jgi:HEPN domain-containing protein
MKRISNEKISRYKKILRQLIDELDKKAFKSIYPDTLFRGSPVEVYRKCGKKNCKCTKGGENRHGPYKVIQVNRDGKQRQLTIKPGQEKYFEMAKSYVWHSNNYRSIKELLNKIDKLIETIINERLEENINDEQ